MISASLGRAKMERGQHLRPRQKQNKPSGREQLRACRPSKRGGSCLKTSPAPAATTHPRLPRLIGRFESCGFPSAAGPSLRDRTGLPRSQPGRRRGGGEEWKRGRRAALFPCCSKIFPDCSLGARGPGWSWSRRGQEVPLAKADCEVLSPVPGLRPLAPRGTRPPGARRGVTFADVGSCAKVPAQTGFLFLTSCVFFPLRNHHEVKNESFLTKPRVGGGAAALWEGGLTPEWSWTEKLGKVAGRTAVLAWPRSSRP